LIGGDISTILLPCTSVVLWHIVSMQRVLEDVLELLAYFTYFGGE
jgi:hypothetical protein